LCMGYMVRVLTVVLMLLCHGGGLLHNCRPYTNETLFRDAQTADGISDTTAPDDDVVEDTGDTMVSLC
jgi:hypothetical protein